MDLLFIKIKTSINTKQSLSEPNTCFIKCLHSSVMEVFTVCSEAQIGKCWKELINLLSAFSRPCKKKH